MRKLMIAPSVGCCDLFHIEEQVRLINEKSDYLHMDIKDGVYVPSYGIGPDYLDYLNKHIDNLKPMDAHLMVKHPQQYLELFAKSGAEYITPHTDCIEGDAFVTINKGKLLRRTIVGSLVLIGMNTIQYTLMNWMPSMLKSMGFDTSQSQFMTMFGLFGAPFGIFIASLIMDKIPRRVMGVALLAGMAGLGIATDLLAPTLGMTGIIVMTFLLNTVIYMYVCYASAVYVPEMWPTSAKLSGSGFCNAMGRVSNIFFPFLVTYVAASIGAPAVFILIAIVAIIIAVSIIFFGVETRGESVEDIGNID